MPLDSSSSPFRPRSAAPAAPARPPTLIPALLCLTVALTGCQPAADAGLAGRTAPGRAAQAPASAPATAAAAAPAATLAAAVPLRVEHSWEEPQLISGAGSPPRRAMRPVTWNRPLKVDPAADWAQVEAELKRLYDDLEAAGPREVRFAEQGEEWVAEARTGWQVDREASLAAARSAWEAGTRTFAVVAGPQRARRDADWAERQGLRHLGTGESSFEGSADFRIHNIRTGAQKLHGRWVGAGEELDFNAAVGTISRAAGFVPGYVVQGRTLALEDGGGLCQVSTTAFRAAYRAGLPITERHAHSYQVGYYGEPGLDAAVYAPRLNLRWRNDTGGPVLVQTEWNLEAQTLKVHLFGRSDGRQVTVSAPQLSDRQLPPPPTYVPDPALNGEEVYRVDMPAPGLRAEATRTVRWPDGRTRRDTQVSRYRPWGGVFAAAPQSPRLR